MIIESCNNYIIHKVTQILIIMHYLSKISMQTGQCMYKKQKVLRLSNIICIFAAKSLIYAEHRFVTCRFTIVVNFKRKMMNRIFKWVTVAIRLLVLTTVFCGANVLTSCTTYSNDNPTAMMLGGRWDPQVQTALNELISNCGEGSYAVFDFDQTSIVHDITQALWVYQIEHLCFADAPIHDFLDGIPEPESLMPATETTYAEMGRVLSEEFETMTARLEAGESIESIWQSDIYLDFRARMHSLFEAMDEQWGSWVAYLWQPGLLAGYTEDEARTLIHDAILEHLGRDKLAVEQWKSPDGHWGGNVMRGIWVSPEMKELYRCLKAANIETYVCSASLELIVKVLACDPVLGFGLPADKVYGLRFVDGAKLIAKFDPQYKQPIKEGKVDCIKAYMTPAYGNTGPVLVAGDSNGDVPMLTAFPDMKYGLIIDVGRSETSAIGQLATQARKEGNTGIYILQPSFEDTSPR